MSAVTVDVAHELLESVLCVEHFLTCLAFLVGAKVAQGYAYAGIKIGQLSHTSCHDVPLEVGCREYGGVGPELLTRTAQVGLAYNLYRIERLSLLIFLLVYLAVAEHL